MKKPPKVPAQAKKTHNVKALEKRAEILRGSGAASKGPPMPSMQARPGNNLAVFKKG